jgi:hypothetical protein
MHLSDAGSVEDRNVYVRDIEAACMSRVNFFALKIANVENE